VQIKQPVRFLSCEPQVSSRDETLASSIREWNENGQLVANDSHVKRRNTNCALD